MMKITYYCDGCGTQLSDEQAQASLAMAKPLGKLAEEQFCSECSTRALDYWKSKAILYTETVQEGLRRIINHRNKFFSK